MMTKHLTVPAVVSALLLGCLGGAVGCQPAEDESESSDGALRGSRPKTFTEEHDHQVVEVEAGERACLSLPKVDGQEWMLASLPGVAALPAPSVDDLESGARLFCWNDDAMSLAGNFLVQARTQKVANAPASEASEASEQDASGSVTERIQRGRSRSFAVVIKIGKGIPDVLHVTPSYPPPSTDGRGVTVESPDVLVPLGWRVAVHLPDGRKEGAEWDVSIRETKIASAGIVLRASYARADGGSDDRDATADFAFVHTKPSATLPTRISFVQTNASQKESGGYSRRYFVTFAPMVTKNDGPRAVLSAEREATE